MCAYPTQTLQIQRIIIHPKYNDKEFTDNIALVELLTPADTTQPNVKPICLPVTNELYSNQTSNLLTIGISFSKQSFVEKHARYVNSSQCIDMYLDEGLRLNLDEKRICGKLSAEATDDCAELFSGAPLQELRTVGTAGEERYVLRGFELFNKHCDYTLPIVYKNMFAYLDWMLYNMRFNEVNVDSSLEAKWAIRQKNHEKLGLFNMSSCGILLKPPIEYGYESYNPWIGSLVLNTGVRSPTSKVILISERYALAPAQQFSGPNEW